MDRVDMIWLSYAEAQKLSSYLNSCLKDLCWTKLYNKKFKINYIVMSVILVIKCICFQIFQIFEIQY